jgi:hypothetical protein
VSRPDEPEWLRNQLIQEAKEFIRKEYLQDPDSDSQMYDADDMVNAWLTGYLQRGEEN